MLDKQKIIVLLVVSIFLSSLLFFVNGDVLYWTEYAWMFPVALMIALTVNTLGVSGAAMFVPFFILIFPIFAEPMSAAQSVRVGLITESFGLSSSALAFLSYGLVDKKIATYAILGAIPFVIGGTFITELVPQSILYLMVAILLIVAVMLIFYKKVITERRLTEATEKIIDYSRSDEDKITITAQDNIVYTYCRPKSGYKKRFYSYGIGGFFQGAAGFGIGEMGIVSMILTNIPTRIAIGTSHLVVAATAILAAIMHVTNSVTTGELIPWNLLFMTVPAVVIGGQLAPLVAAKLKTVVLEKALIVMFVTVAIALIALSFGYYVA